MNTGVLTITAIPATAIDPATGLPDVSKARSSSGNRKYNPALPWDDGTPTSQKFRPTIQFTFLVDSSGFFRTGGTVTFNSYDGTTGGTAGAATISGPIPDCAPSFAPSTIGTKVHCVRVNCNDKPGTHMDPNPSTDPAWDGSVSCMF